MKKKAGPSAGIPRASGERNSPVGNGTQPNQLGLQGWRCIVGTNLCIRAYRDDHHLPSPHQLTHYFRMTTTTIAPHVEAMVTLYVVMAVRDPFISDVLTLL